IFFFFSSRRRHTRFSRDWSSDVCSSDLLVLGFDSTSKPFFTKKSTAVPIPMLSSFAAFSKFMLFPSVIYYLPSIILILQKYVFRSEERRVGKECRSRWSS